MRSELEQSVSLSAVIKCGWAHPMAPLGGDELWVEMCGLFSVYLIIYRPLSTPCGLPDRKIKPDLEAEAMAPLGKGDERERERRERRERGESEGERERERRERERERERESERERERGEKRGGEGESRERGAERESGEREERERESEMRASERARQEVVVLGKSIMSERTTYESTYSQPRIKN